MRTNNFSFALLTLLVICEGGPRHRYQKLMFARVNLEWLTDGKDKLISRKEK